MLALRMYEQLHNEFYVANDILATKHHTYSKERARFEYQCSCCKGLPLQNKKVNKFVNVLTPGIK